MNSYCMMGCDMFKLNIHTSQHYTITSAYHYLTASKNVTTQESSYIIWHKLVPLKTSLFDWLLLKNHIPTSNNLLRRGSLQNQQQLCADGCGSNEDINHLFLHFNLFGSIWTSVLQWLGYVTVIHAFIYDHLHQFGYLIGTSKHHRSAMYLLWLLMTEYHITFWLCF